MLIKTLVIIAFIAIIVSLGSALFQLVKYKDQENSQKALKLLTWRISLSVMLFLLVVIALGTGLLKPSGIGAKVHAQNAPANP